MLASCARDLGPYSTSSCTVNRLSRRNLVVDGVVVWILQREIHHFAARNARQEQIEMDWSNEQRQKLSIFIFFFQRDHQKTQRQTATQGIHNLKKTDTKKVVGTARACGLNSHYRVAQKSFNYLASFLAAPLELFDRQLSANFAILLAALSEVLGFPVLDPLSCLNLRLSFSGKSGISLAEKMVSRLLFWHKFDRRYTFRETEVDEAEHEDIAALFRFPEKHSDLLSSFSTLVPDLCPYLLPFSLK
nr:hypothetical protein Iba_chr12fCG1060 [Ipomoea batatas]